MSDLTEFTAAKSDQLTADDLISSGPITITITKVVTNGGAEQPVTIYYAENEKKPFRPCKNMVRAMVHMWGKPTALGPRLEADDCIGRSLTLYRDPEVKYGGLKVGGIRISHASHLSTANEMALTIARGRKSAYTVRPLVQPKSAPAASTATKRPSVSEWFTALQAALNAADSEDAVHAIRAREDVQSALSKLTGDTLGRLNAMMKAALDRFATPTDPAAVDEEAEF